MRFFSKFVFICNLCFVAAVIIRWVEITNHVRVHFDQSFKFQPLESTLVVLGYGAIFVNFFYNIITFILFILKKEQAVAKWLIWSNFLFLPVQLIYFFF